MLHLFMAKAKEKRTEQVAFRFEKTLINELSTEAKEQYRTLASWVRFLLNTHPSRKKK